MLGDLADAFTHSPVRHGLHLRRPLLRVKNGPARDLMPLCASQQAAAILLLPNGNSSWPPTSTTPSLCWWAARSDEREIGGLANSGGPGSSRALYLEVPSKIREFHKDKLTEWGKRGMVPVIDLLARRQGHVACEDLPERGQVGGDGSRHLLRPQAGSPTKPNQVVGLFDTNSQGRWCGVGPEPHASSSLRACIGTVAG